MISWKRASKPGGRHPKGEILVDTAFISPVFRSRHMSGVIDRVFGWLGEFIGFRRHRPRLSVMFLPGPASSLSSDWPLCLRGVCYLNRVPGWYIVLACRLRSVLQAYLGRSTVTDKGNSSQRWQMMSYSMGVSPAAWATTSSILPVRAFICCFVELARDKQNRP
jgi:hypothetical protein